MKKICVLYGNCQVMIHVYNILKNLTPFANEYFSKIKNTVNIVDIKPYSINKQEPEKFKHHDL